MNILKVYSAQQRKKGNAEAFPFSDLMKTTRFDLEPFYLNSFSLYPTSFDHLITRLNTFDMSINETFINYGCLFLTAFLANANPPIIPALSPNSGVIM